jgi:hypothetical protein
MVRHYANNLNITMSLEEALAIDSVTMVVHSLRVYIVEADQSI